ncbi:uncharacterized protein V6R79_019060 [Siganus canaliculatus]
MEQKLQLCVLAALIQVSLAVWQHVTIMKGQTLELSCPLTNAHQAYVDWKNPEGYIMYFQHTTGKDEGIRDERYSIKKRSASEFTITISDVTLEDGGIYTCTQYHHPIIEKTVMVTVLNYPKMRKTKHNRRFDIKCAAEASQHPPQILWKVDDGPEIIAHSQVNRREKKVVTIAMLRLRPLKNRVTVKCLVRHPELHSPLMNFVKVGQNSIKSRRRTTTSPTTAQSRRPVEVKSTTSSWFSHEPSTIRDVNGPSSTAQTDRPSGSSLKPAPSAGSPLSTLYSQRTTTLPLSTRTENDTTTNATSSTGRFPDNEKQSSTEGSSATLVFLVTCLIFCLLVVVIFFAIKLRRAHILWKRENEDSNPSEESSKSKSSQEEKNSQGQTRRGLFNMPFTKYVVEEPPAIPSENNTVVTEATENGNEEKTSQPQTSEPTPAKCEIKETEL